MKQTTLLEIQDLSVQYPSSSLPVIQHLSFTAHSGQFILVAGPSGGGKSSLLYSINGVIPHLMHAQTKGDILLDGSSLMQMPPAKRAHHLGSVLQNPDDQIIFDAIEDEVAFPLENLQVPQQQMQPKIDEALASMQLDTTQNPNHLSGGEKQKLVTATTLAMGQKVLLFDEPLANLDYRGAIRLLNTLHTLCKKQGYIVLFVEHRLDWVLDYADSILWIEEGFHRSFSSQGEFIPFWQNQIESALSFTWKQTNTATNSSPVLQAQNLSWSVGKKQLLFDVNFTLRQGERWVLIGNNGSGKTSFINLLAGLQKPTGGKVICSYSKKEKYKKIGVIMQNPNYQLFMPTVQQEIAYKATSPQRAAHLIDAFELQGLEERHPHSLSEGQKRKVGVASILAMEPEVLLFDEPTVGQDYRSLSLIIRELNRMNERAPLTMLTITHDTRCAHFLGEQFLWMEEGRLIQSGGSSVLQQYRDGDML